MCCYTDASGKPRLQTFKKKGEAEDYRVRIENELRTGTHIAKAEAKTVAEIADAFVASYELKMQGGTIGRGYFENLRSSVRLHIKPHLGAMPFPNLTATAVEEWAGKLRKVGNTRSGERCSLWRVMGDETGTNGPTAPPLLLLLASA